MSLEEPSNPQKRREKYEYLEEGSVDSSIDLRFYSTVMLLSLCNVSTEKNPFLFLLASLSYAASCFRPLLFPVDCSSSSSCSSLSISSSSMGHLEVDSGTNSIYLYKIRRAKFRGLGRNKMYLLCGLEYYERCLL